LAIILGSKSTKLGGNEVNLYDLNNFALFIKNINLYQMRFLLITTVLLICGLFSCKSKEPSILKIFVRSNNFILTPDATVRIVGDLSEGTPEYFEETRTDPSGIAYFELDAFFDTYDKDQDKVAYFTVYAKDSANTFTVGDARARANLTSTASITLDE
jgi:hypothetical protein